MLTLEIIAVGKVKAAWIQSGIDHYSKLLGKYARLKLTVLRDAGTGQSVRDGLALEAGRIEAALDPRALTVLLDQAGEQISSERLARFLDKTQSRHSCVQFVIGGAFGLAKSLDQPGRQRLSLSPMTLPHELCQVVLLEQLYRALSINAGSAYHK